MTNFRLPATFPATVVGLAAFVNGLEIEVRNRGYQRVELKIGVEADGGLILSGSIVNPEAPAGDQTHYVYVHGNDGPHLLERLGNWMAERLPPISEFRRKEFARLMEKAAEMADRIGEEVPEFNTFADVLRDQLRSNLLEDLRKPQAIAAE